MSSEFLEAATAEKSNQGFDMVFCDYANEQRTLGLRDPNLGQNNDELNHRLQSLDTSKSRMQ